MALVPKSNLYDREQAWQQMEQFLASDGSAIDAGGDEFVTLVEQMWLQVVEGREAFCDYLAKLEGTLENVATARERLKSVESRTKKHIERLERFALGTILALSKTKDGKYQKLSGETWEMSAQRNPASVDVYSVEDVPDAYKRVTVVHEMPMSVWKGFESFTFTPKDRLAKLVQVTVDKKALAAILKKWLPCEECGELGVIRSFPCESMNPAMEICPACKGEKRIHPIIPGARLVEDVVRLVRK